MASSSGTTDGAFEAESYRQALASVPEAVLRTDVTGASATTYAIGGRFGAFLEVADENLLSQALAALHHAELPFRIIGAGSNLLISSAGLAGFTIRLGRGFRYLKPISEGRFSVGGSMSLMALSRELSEQGYAGLEFAGGIPASVGGAVVMNAGAHGGELSQVVERVAIVTNEGLRHELKAEELKFSYRHSVLPLGAVVTAIELKVVAGDRSAIAERRKHFLAERKARQPLQSPSAGSVFRNPTPTQSAGLLIEQAGLKGLQIGGAQVSLLHGNWIVNESRAASDEDVRGLIQTCQERVRTMHGVSLVPEVIYWE